MHAWFSSNAFGRRLPPKIFEPVRRQLSVPNGVLNIAMPKIRL
jgi:hypothetical protein